MTFYKRPILWIALGLLFPMGMSLDQTSQRSSLWFLEWPLYLLLLILALVGGLHSQPPRRWVAGTYLGLSLAFAAGFELSLTVDGTGWGGYHQETRWSFLLSAGYYIPAAWLACWVAQHWKMGFGDMALFAFGVSLNEALIFRPMLLQLALSPAFALAPIGLAYFAVVYALFYALPLLVISPASLHRQDASPPPGALALIAGGALGGFACHVFMGLIHAPIVQAIFGISASQGG